MTKPRRSLFGVNLALLTTSTVVLVVCVLLAGVVVVVGAFRSAQVHQDRATEATEQERFGDVLSAAGDEVEAFINIDYRNAQESIDAVASGATGDFKKQYDTSSDGVIDVLERNKSVMDGKVLWSGVVNVDADSATVIAATTGTVANVSTDNKPVARSFRIKVDLVREDGHWLTNNLEFVG